MIFIYLHNKLCWIGFRTLQGAVSTATITYRISSRARLENIWRCYFKGAGSDCHKPWVLSKIPLYASNSKTVQDSKADMHTIWILWRSLVPMHITMLPQQIGRHLKPNWSCSCWYSFDIQPSWDQEQNSYCQVVQQEVVFQHTLLDWHRIRLHLSALLISFQCLGLWLNIRDSWLGPESMFWPRHEMSKKNLAG